MFSVFNSKFESLLGLILIRLVKAVWLMIESVQFYRSHVSKAAKRQQLD